MCLVDPVQHLNLMFSSFVEQRIMSHRTPREVNWSRRPFAGSDLIQAMTGCIHTIRTGSMLMRHLFSLVVFAVFYDCHITL